MRIFLVRHPAPTGADGLCYGQLEVSVDPRVTEAAEASIRPAIPENLLADAHICSSPSQRCLGLARLLSPLSEPTIYEDLHEMNFGAWQGRRWSEIDRLQLDAWAADIWNYRPGGGESAESVAIRWRRWLNTMQQNATGNVIAITHAGVIRVALARSGPSLGRSEVTETIPFASVHELLIDRSYGASQLFTPAV